MSQSQRPSVSIENLYLILDNSAKFSAQNKYGSTSTLCDSLLKAGVSEDELLKNANSCYPIIHHSVLNLSRKFLELKRKHGSKVEKELYKDMKIPDFIDRLLSKRPLVFVGQRDTFILRDGGKEGVAFDRWLTVGTDNEESPLVLRDYLSYDEGKISALLGASTRTVTINKGDRKNGGVVSQEDDFEKSGVIVGLVGPRMNKNMALESQELRVTEEQNTKEYGYGVKLRDKPTTLNLFAEFYGLEYLPKFSELHSETDSSSKISRLFSRKSKKMLDGYKEITGFINTPAFLHIPAYNKRNRITFEMLLAEANHRASAERKQAYVHVVGLGLGVWRIYNGQVELFTSEFVKTAARMKLEHVSDIDFSWVINHKASDGEEAIKHNADVVLRDGDTVPDTNIKIHISKRDPWDKLQGEHEGKLVVASWAWDGMSFVGNEYWAGSLVSSSDPAAACCTQIPELLNSYVNPVFCGNNAMVVTEKGSLEPIHSFMAEGKCK